MTDQRAFPPARCAVLARVLRTALLTGGFALLAPGLALAATRYASSSPGAVASGSCPITNPCEIGYAIGQAPSGSEVVVEPGDYAVTQTLVSTVPVNVHGQPGLPLPRLIGDASLHAETLELKDSTVSDLSISSSAPADEALELRGGTAERLVLSATGAQSHGATLEGSSAGPSILRDSLALSQGSSGDAVFAHDPGSGAGPVSILNVTAIAAGASARGIASAMTSADLSIENTIARGPGGDLGAAAGAHPLKVSYSNFRSAGASAYVDLGHNQDAAPVFADVVNGDYRERQGSPTIDAGLVDPLAGLSDLDGHARSVGAATDLGAFEYVPAPTNSAVPAPSSPAVAATETLPTSAPAPAPVHNPVRLTPSVPAISPPVAGKSIVVGTFQGAAMVRLPGQHHFVPLTAASQLPVDSLIDARRGYVALVTAQDLRGTSQAALVTGGVFQVRQIHSAHPFTDLVLRGGSFHGCQPATGTMAQAARAARRVVRRLWAQDSHGHFRTHGLNSVATVRGTTWVTDELCAGTLTRVFTGQVAVHDRHLHRTVIVTAGHSYLARSPGF